MLCVNRYNGEIEDGDTFTFMGQYETVGDIIDGEDWRYIEVDLANAKVVSKLIRKGVTVYMAPSGITPSLISARLVIDTWRYDVIDRINKLLETDANFRDCYNKYVEGIELACENIPKWIIDYDQDEYKPFHPEILTEYEATEDYDPDVYAIKATSIAFKYFGWEPDPNIDLNLDDDDDKDEEDFEKEVERWKYYIDLWNWVYSIIDIFVKE